MTVPWTPGIGDPSVIGWVTVALYFIAAGACALVAVRAKGTAQGGTRFWVTIAALMIALGVNKQLDLQTLFTQLMRDNALYYGWFSERRTVQIAFILAVASAAPIIAAISIRHLALLRRNMRLAVWGVCLIYAYVIIRAASFHHIDRFINARILGARWNCLLEIGGISIVMFAALRKQPVRDPSARAIPDRR